MSSHLRQPILQRKPPAKRAFYGIVGSPLSAPVKPPALSTLSLAETLRCFRGATLIQPIACDASLLQNGGPPRPMFTMTAAAIRAAKWREKQKQADPNFNQRQTERRASERANERAEADRIQEIEDTLKVNPSNDRNVLFLMSDAICTPDGVPILDSDGKPIRQASGEPGEKQLLITGGMSPEEISRAQDKTRVKTGRVTPNGFGSRQTEDTPANSLPKEFEDSFAPVFKRSKSVAALHRFVFENTKKVTMKNTGTQIVSIVKGKKVTHSGQTYATGHRICLICQKQIGLGSDIGEDVEACFRHFEREHPEAFEILMGRINKTACSEDHDGMVRRHGGGDMKIQCKRCKKVLYKPPKK